MTVRVNGKNFYVGNNKVSFTNTIDRVVEFDKYYVVLVMDDEVPDNNIYAVDHNGTIVWNISEIIKFSYPEAYVSMGKRGDEVLNVITYNGVEFLIDTNQDAIVGKEIVK